ATRLYRKQHDKSLKAQNTAAELKLRAERKLGTLLKETVKRGGDHGNQHVAKSQDETLATLPADISKTQSHRWQAPLVTPRAMGSLYEAHWHLLPVTASWRVLSPEERRPLSGRRWHAIALRRAEIRPRTGAIQTPTGRVA